MTLKIAIRKAKRSDLDHIVALWKDFSDFHSQLDPHFSRSPRGHVNFKKFASEKMRSRTSQVLVATMNGRAVGYLIASIIKYPPVFKEKQCGFIFDLMVHRDFRRTGIGTKLFSEARNWFIRKKINRIELSVAATNPLATAFWEKMGFKTYVERKYMRLR